MSRRPCVSPLRRTSFQRFAAVAGDNAAGLAMIDDGLVIDVSQMKEISVDAARLTATAQAGQLTRASSIAKLMLMAWQPREAWFRLRGSPGLTLGGGVGWLMGRCGLVCDNTLSYDIVLPGGELVRANAGEHEDLFWALKGGGGNFGVVTSITYQCIPLRCSFGLVVHPLAHASEVLKFYRDFTMAGLPDELIVYVAALLLAGWYSGGGADSRVVRR